MLRRLTLSITLKPRRTVSVATSIERFVVLPVIGADMLTAVEFAGSSSDQRIEGERQSSCCAYYVHVSCYRFGSVRTICDSSGMAWAAFQRSINRASLVTRPSMRQADQTSVIRSKDIEVLDIL
jgi:hypothetical protein